MRKHKGLCRLQWVKKKVKVRRSRDCWGSHKHWVLSMMMSTGDNCEPGIKGMNMSCMIRRLEPSNQEDTEVCKVTNGHLQ